VGKPTLVVLLKRYERVWGDENREMPVLLTAPMIPQESSGMGQESTRMTGFWQEWNWIPQESTGMGYFE
jgi:hypothetical protein